MPRRNIPHRRENASPIDGNRDIDMPSQGQGTEKEKSERSWTHTHKKKGCGRTFPDKRKKTKAARKKKGETSHAGLVTLFFFPPSSVQSIFTQSYPEFARLTFFGKVFPKFAITQH